MIALCIYLTKFVRQFNTYIGKKVESSIIFPIFFTFSISCYILFIVTSPDDVYHHRRERARVDIQALWAKTKPYKSLITHLKESGICASVLLADHLYDPKLRFLRKEFPSLSDTQIINFCSYIVALHDIGKASLWQNLAPEMKDTLDAAGFKEMLNALESDIRHEQVSSAYMEYIWRQNAANDKKTRNMYRKLLEMHHQRPYQYLEPIKAYGWNHESDWKEVASNIHEQIKAYFGIETDELPVPCHKDAVSIVLEGLIIVCDWAASSEYFANLGDAYLQSKEDALAVARAKMREIGILATRVPSYGGLFSEMFPDIQQMRPVQEACQALDFTAPLTMIEAQMGEGKTEAALYLSNQICAATGCTGIYFATPTQATSNQMYFRLNDYLSRIGAHRSRLLHSNAMFQMADESSQYSEAQEVSKWLAPLRLGMLEENGIGTVDQPMSGVLDNKFAILRIFGLIGKVLIVDEIHAYDEYMSTILKTLFEWCKVLLIPVILLSATMQQSQRKTYVHCFCHTLCEYTPAEEYPLITQVRQDGSIHEYPLPAYTKRVCKFCPVRGNNPELIAKLAMAKIANGGKLCVLLNTVKKAQEVYLELKNRIKEDDATVLLLHAKYEIANRAKKENGALRLFGKDNNDINSKIILVATQVVEQSLDVDFDVMITELAPIDLLIQRSGREWRHLWKKRPGCIKELNITVLLPDSDEANITKRYSETPFYAPEVLRETESLFSTVIEMRFPEDIRRYVSSVYDCSNLKEYHKKCLSDQTKANFQCICSPDERDEVPYTILSVDHEYDDGYESTFFVSTRLCQPTIRIAFCDRNLYEKCLNETQKRLTLDDEKAIIQHSVSILSDHKPTDAYELNKGHVKGVFVTDKQHVFINGNRYLNDPELGLVKERKEEEK